MERRRKYHAAWISAAIVIVLGAAAYYFLRPEKKSAPSASKEPSVSMEITGENTLSVNWQYLSPDAQFLDIYETTQGVNEGSLVERISLPDNSKDKGSTEVKTNDVSLNDTSFYVQAITGETNQEQNIIWTSPPIVPSPSSTPQNPPGDETGTQPANPSSTPPDSTPTFPAPSSTTPTSTTGNPPTPTSTPPDNSPSPSSTPTSTTSTPPSQPTSTTNTPPPATSFQVSNSNAWVDITWQYLPSSTVSLEISRSTNPAGPWAIFYSQQNPEIIGPYTIREPENTPNTAFFYLLTAYGTSTVVGTNGPIYLSASRM